jgi:hypothetical protein
MPSVRLAVVFTTLAAAISLSVALSGCSDIYYDRRETVALGADDHIGVNRVAQMIDPWPRYVGNKNIAFNGERAQAAVERYRHDCSFQPLNPTTTSLAQQQTMQQIAIQRCAAANQAQAAVQGAPAAPVAASK